MKSKRIEILDNRPVNKDGFIDEWPEMGFVAMKSPYDPKPSIRIENGKIMELDGKERKDFDFLDQFIADYAIRIDRAEQSMGISSVDIARKIVDINVSRKEVLELVSGITPAKMSEVINQLNVVEMMMGMQKMRARRVPGNQAQEGDKVVTSSVSSKFLKGILIGYVSEVEDDANNLTKTGTIIPAVDFENIQEVLVIKQLKQQADPSEEGEEE